MTLARADDLGRHSVGDVVDALARVCDPLPRTMLVGAACRDALHVQFGHPFSLRSTDDLDLALAVDGLEQFEQITHHFPRKRLGAGTVRFDIAGRAVDLVPFGAGVENPDGVVTPHEPMSVFGFRDGLAHARRIELTDGHVVHYPIAPGYTLLKLKAWADRSAYGLYKDGSDLACSMFWYQNDPATEERLYSSERDNFAHLTAAEWDPDIAAVRLLIADATAMLPEARRSELRNVWDSLRGGDALLASQLTNDRLPTWPTGQRAPTRLALYAAAVRAVIATP